MSKINVNEFLKYMSGNQGLTQKIIHYGKKEKDSVRVLSSSLEDDTSMGFVSENLILPNKKKIKVFDNKEGILVSRNGNAGRLTYLPKGKYTMNDHAYILYLKDEYVGKINLQWLSFTMQQEALKYLTIEVGNKTWNITRFMKNGVIDIPQKEDGAFDYEYQTNSIEQLIQISEQKQKIEELLNRLNRVYVTISADYKFDEIKITDLFTPSNGNSELTKTFCVKNKGIYPVYSGNTQGEYARIAKYEYDGEYLTWAKDGLAGLMMYHNEKFSITGHRGILVPTKKCIQIDFKYIKYVLEPIFRKNKKGRLGDLGKNEYTTLNPDMIKKLKDKIPIPINKDGTFDLEAQKQIASRYDQIEMIKKNLTEKIERITNVYVE